MALSDEQLARLVNDLQQSVYDGLTADAGFALLNDTRTVTTTSQRPKPMTVAAILGAVGAGSLAKLAVNPNLTDIRDKIQQQDFTGVGLWGQILVGGGQIETAEYAAIMAELSATEDVETAAHVPPRIATAFSGKNPDDPASPLASMPNQIERSDFDAAWLAAGRAV